MQIRVRFFAVHRERFGTDRLDLDLPVGAVVADLIDAISTRFPDFAGVAKTTRIAVNREYAPSTTILHDGDDVALIPPVAGGGF